MIFIVEEYALDLNEHSNFLHMDLLDKIKDRASVPSTIHDMAEGLSPAPKINPKLTPAEIQKAEEELGFKFPQLLIDIYSQIGDGGFGPGYGLYTLQEAKKIYLQYIGDPECEWEKGTWPLCTWGCNIESFTDCVADGYTVYFTNENLLDDSDDHGVSFELRDKDGNLISSGTGGNIMDVLNGASGGASRPDENDEDDDEEDEEDEDEPGLIYHKDTLEEWFSDWTDGVDLWDEMSGDEEDEEEEEDETNEPPHDFGSRR